MSVVAVYGTSATTGATQKHTLMLEPNLKYLFIPCIYIDGEPAYDKNADYNLRLKVVATAKGKVPAETTTKGTAGGRPFLNDNLIV